MNPLSRIFRSEPGSRFFGMSARRLAEGVVLLLFAAGVAADVSSINVANSSATVLNGAAASMDFPVMRSGDTSYAVSIGYSSMDGTAVAGIDYMASAGILSFPAGGSSATITVPITGESGVHPSKQFSMSLADGLAFGNVTMLGASGFAVVADFNGDGKPDIALGNGSTISILLNTTLAGATTASFATPVSFAASSANWLAVGDFNGDGKPDLVVSPIAERFGAVSLSILINTTPAGATTPSFAAPSTVDFLLGGGNAVVGDFNGDGKPDLAVPICDAGTPQVEVMLNTTPARATTASFTSAFSGGFTVAPMGDTNYPTYAGVGDFNGDGKPDLVVVSQSGGTIAVLLNTAAGGATAPSFAAYATVSNGTNLPQNVVVTDFNGDGRNDLAVAFNEGSTGGDLDAVKVFLNTTATGDTKSSFTAPADFLVGGADLAFITSGDFVGNGKPDLVAAAGTAGAVAVLLNSTPSGGAMPGFSAPINTVSGTQAAVGDFNGDGRLDLVTKTGAVVLNARQRVSVSPSPATGTILYESSIPQAFSFTPVTGAQPGATVTSNSITVSGINIPSSISITGGKYSVNGGAYSTSPGTVNPGVGVKVQLVASANNLTQNQAKLNIGGVIGTFTVTTAGSGSGSSGSGSSGSSSSSGGSGGGGGSISPFCIALFGLARLFRKRSK